MANNDKNGVFKNTHFLLAHSGINRTKAFFERMNLKKIYGLSGKTDMSAILKRRQARGIRSKNMKITPFWT